MTFSSSDPLPKLDDRTYIKFMSEFTSNILKNRSILRSQTKGFIACKFSALAYLLISAIWVDSELDGYTAKMDLLKKIHFLVNVRREEYAFMGPNFINKYLNALFIENRRSRTHESTHIRQLTDIRFEDGAALLGIIHSGSYGFAHIEAGEILHYFIVVKRGAPNPTTGEQKYAFISSYGSDKVAFNQFETPLYPATFNSFIESLSRYPKNEQDQRRINKYIRAHFLNVHNMVKDKKDQTYVSETIAQIKKEIRCGIPRTEPPAFYEFLNSPRYENKNNPEDITAELKSYTIRETNIVQFNNIYQELHYEMSERKHAPNRIEEGRAACMLNREEKKAAIAAEKMTPRMKHKPSLQSRDNDGPTTRSKTKTLALSQKLENELTAQGDVNENDNSQENVNIGELYHNNEENGFGGGNIKRNKSKRKQYKKKNYTLNYKHKTHK